MADYHEDQAAGLRRLFDSAHPRIVTFAAGSSGVGKSVLVANLASSLICQGKTVLVLDENPINNVAKCFGLASPYDLQQVVNCELPLEKVLLTSNSGVRILPAARMTKQLGAMNAFQQKTLLEILTGMNLAADIILVDASSDHPLGFSPFGLAAHDTVIVVSVSSASITGAYALIKKVSLGYSRKNFRILVNKARSIDEAIGVYSNLAEVTQSRGLASLEYVGFVPQDDLLRQAEQLCQPVEGLFPEAPATKACRHIARALCQWPLPEDDSVGLEQFVQQLLHLSQRIDPIAIYA